MAVVTGSPLNIATAVFLILIDKTERCVTFMDQVLKNEIMQYLKASRLTTEVQVEEMVSVPLSKLYQEQDLVHTPEGTYYSKQEVFH